MRWLIAVVMLLFNLPAAAEQPLPRPKSVEFKLRLLEGDPKGSIEAGTVKVLSKPTMATIENSTCEFSVGWPTAAADGVGGMRTIVHSRRVEIQCGPVKNGTVRIDLRASFTESTEENDAMIELDKRVSQSIRTVVAGKRETFLFPSTFATKTWLEMTVGIPESLKPEAVPPLPGSEVRPDPVFFPKPEERK